MRYFLSTMFSFQGGVYTNTVVVQRHSVVMTKTDKIYKVGAGRDEPICGGHIGALEM